MAALRVTPFAPAQLGVTVSLAATTTPSSVQFDNVLPQGGGFRKSNTVRIVNVGPSGVFIEITGSGQPNNVSAATGMFLGAGVTEKFTTAGGTFLAAERFELL